MAMKRYKYSKTALSLGLTICENRSCTRMNVCSGSISLSLQTENFPERVTENFKSSRLTFFSTLYPIPSRHVSNDADYINIIIKRGQWVFTFSLVLTKIIYSFLQYSTVLYESGKFLNDLFGWVEEGKKMRKKNLFLYVLDLEIEKVERIKKIYISVSIYRLGVNALLVPIF